MNPTDLKLGDHVLLTQDDGAQHLGSVTALREGYVGLGAAGGLVVNGVTVEEARFPATWVPTWRVVKAERVPPVHA